MKIYTVEELNKILELHKKWRLGEEGGERANLRGAYLRGAYLEGAYLRGANLRGANLEGAYLEGAYLRDANLKGAYLEGAYLRDANLRDANLRDANLRDANLKGAYLEGAKYGEEALIKYFCIGPIGSRSDYLQVFHTDKQVILRTGCFTGNVDEFTKAVNKTHRDSKFLSEYQAAVTFISTLTNI